MWTQEELPALLWCERLEHILDRQKAKMNLGQDQLRPLQSCGNRCPEHLQRGHLKLPTLLLSFPVWPPRLAMAEAHSLEQVDDIKVKWTIKFQRQKIRTASVFLRKLWYLRMKFALVQKLLNLGTFWEVLARTLSAQPLPSANLLAGIKTSNWEQPPRQTG